MRIEDGELVGRTLKGDWAAFADLVDRYRDAVSGVAYHYLGDFDDVQDAAQEAFVRAYLHLRDLRDPAKFGPWLRRIATSVCVGVLRRRRAAVSLDAAAEEAMPPATPSPDEDVERLAARLVVREALGRLSDKTRMTATLFYINGYSHSEIAGFLEVPVNTVRSRLQRAKKQLREEMTAMVSDVLHDGKPDWELTRKVVEEAMRRGDEARKGYHSMDAIGHYDEALEALETLEPDPEQQRLKMDALWKKGSASELHVGWKEAIQLYEAALAIATKQGDRKAQARMMVHLGVTCSNARQRDRSREYYRSALDIYRDLGEDRGQADCLMWLGSGHMEAKEVAPGRECYEQALPLFEATDTRDLAAVCRAMLNLIAEVGDDRFPSLIERTAVCEGLEAKAGVVTHKFQPGWGGSDYDDETPKALRVHSILWQVSHLRTFLDLSVPVGGSWSGDAFSYSYQPLRATITVKSNAERVTVPAGTFERCLLTEQVTEESGLPDDAPERKGEMNREFLCGTRRAWYAPGVGLAQLRVQTAEGVEALIQLKDFSVQEESEDCLPLAVGNAWTYGWADVPPEYVAKEAYRVMARKDNIWYLEHYSYLYKE